MDGYWFISDKFKVEPGEDRETNPGRYGAQLSRWLNERLEERGYAVEPVIAEDWGRCVMVQRKPFALWIGCGNVDKLPGTTAVDDTVVWHCFITAEVPLMSRIFSRLDTTSAVEKLHTELGAILGSEPRITLVDDP